MKTGVKYEKAISTMYVESDKMKRATTAIVTNKMALFTKLHVKKKPVSDLKPCQPINGVYTQLTQSCQNH